MLGAYHKYKQERAEQNAETPDANPGQHGMDMDMDMDMPSSTPSPSGTGPDPSPQSPSTPSPSPSTTGSSSGGGQHPATARHDQTYDIANEDVDWQFCEQCQGLFEPGEYEAHFGSAEFDCQR